MTRLVSLLGAAALVPLVAACQPAVNTTLHLSDIIAVGNGDMPRETTSLLQVPMAVERCNAELDTMMAKLGTIVPIRTAYCRATETESYALFESRATLIPSQSERPGGGGLVIEVAAPSSDGERIYELTVVSMTSRAELVEALGLAEADTVPPAIGFMIENDRPEEFGLQFAPVFLDGSPMLPDHGLYLPAREQFEIVLSDVAGAVIAEGNGHMFMTLYPVDQIPAAQR